jgi:hypothetical protein
VIRGAAGTLLFIGLLASGCSHSHGSPSSDHRTIRPPLVRSSAWKTVLDDVAADGRLGRAYPCSVLTAAVAHLPMDGPQIGVPVRKAARNCFAVHGQGP